MYCSKLTKGQHEPEHVRKCLKNVTCSILATYGNQATRAKLGADMMCPQYICHHVCQII